MSGGRLLAGVVRGKTGDSPPRRRGRREKSEGPEWLFLLPILIFKERFGPRREGGRLLPSHPHWQIAPSESAVREYSFGTGLGTRPRPSSLRPLNPPRRPAEFLSLTLTTVAIRLYRERLA